MSLPVLLQTSARFTQSIYYGKTVPSAVPQSRNINTTAPLTGGGPLTGDLTLALTTNPANQTPVGVSRTVTGAVPIAVNGVNTPVTLANDLTISAAQFTSVTGGIVPASGGGAVNVLFANGTWAPVAGGAGVPQTRLINTTAPLMGGGDLSADRTLSIAIANITTTGAVPATGGTDPTKFLCMTNPISWQVAPGAIPGVRLQASTPGTADVGHAHITGTFIADTEIVAGDPLGSLAQGESFYVKQPNLSASPIIASFNSGTAINPGIRFLSARGTRSSPANLNSGDQTLWLQMYTYANGGYLNNSFMEGYTDGALSGGSYPMSLKLRAVPGSGLTESFLRMKGSNGYMGVNQDTPLSTFEVKGTIGIQPKIITAGGSPTTYTILDSDPGEFYLDSTTQAINIYLPSASGRTGRQYNITQVAGVYPSAVAVIGGTQTIGGYGNYYLRKPNASVKVSSDGSNWRIIGGYDWASRSSNLSDSATLANSAANTQIGNGILENGGFAGAVFGLKAFGKFSTTGTPTIDFQITDTIAGVLADSGAITTPNGVTNSTWQLECEWVVRTFNSGTGLATSRPTKGVLTLQNNGSVNNVLLDYNMCLLAPPGTPAPNNGSLNIMAQWGTANPSNSLTLIQAEYYCTPATSIA